MSTEDTTTSLPIESEQSVHTDEVTDKSQALKNLGEDYAQYFNLNDVHERLGANITETVEQMLTQLDELNSLIGLAQSSTDSAKDSVATILTQTAKLEQTYAFIDALQEFMTNMDAMVTRAEERTTAVEQQYSIKIAEVTKSFFSSFGLKKQNSVENTAQATPPTPLPELNILSTGDILNDIKSKARKQQEQQ